MRLPHETLTRRSGRANTIAATAFVVALALTGGASRADAISQMLVRTASVAAICAVLVLPAATDRPRGLVKPIAFFAAIAASILIQLAPLPPALWTVLAGRSDYTAAARIVGAAQPWRPLNLTPDRGWNSLLALLPACAVLVIVSRGPRQNFRYAIALLWIVAFGSALLGLAQMAGGPDSPLRYYAITNAYAPTGLFANRNHQSVLLACALPAIGYWAIATPITQRILHPITVGAVASATIVIALIASGSRAGLVLGVLGTVAALFFWWPLLAPRLSRFSRRGRLAVISLSALLIAGLVAVVVLADRAQSLDRLLGGDQPDMRGAWFKPSEQMLWTFFPWGSGFGSFAAVFPRFESFDLLRWNYANQAHNDWLQVVIEGGLLGALLAAIYLGWWVRRSAWAWRRGARSAALAKLGSIITAMLMLSSVVDYPLRTPLLSALFMFASLCLLDQGSQAPPEDAERVRP